MSALVILVNADERTLRHVEGLLSEQGYLVAALTSFADANRLLATVTPDLLITDLGLHPHAGLQLAIRSHVDHGDVPVIVTHTVDDRAVAAIARHYGAEFIVNPLDNARFLPCVGAAIERRRRQQRPIRRWLRERLPRVVEVEAGAGRALVVDLSYGGVRLAFTEPCDIPDAFKITLPATGDTVTANRVWTARPGAEHRFYCGAEVRDAADDRWRRFVDRVRDA